MRRHVTYLLTAYIHGELPPHLRERVTRHIGACDACYAALLRERELARLLAEELPGLGSPRPEQLARLLPGILAQADRGPAERPQGLPGFGLALGLSLVLTLTVPLLLASPRAAANALPNQPAPAMIVATATQSVTDAPAQAGLALTAVARRFELATEAARRSPAPAPIAQATPGYHQ